MRGNKCNVCHHPEREAIDAAIHSGAETYRVVGERFAVPHKSVGRHAIQHLGIPSDRGRRNRGACLVCDHPNVASINLRILSDESHSALGAELGFSGSKVHRHAFFCLGWQRGHMGPTPCAVCNHPEREQIERELAAAIPARQVAAVAAKYELSRAAYRHMTPEHAAFIASRSASRLAAVERFVGAR